MLKKVFVQPIQPKADHRQKGFTLIELLAVFVILAILAGVAVPFIGNIIENSRLDATRSTAVYIYEASRLYLIGENKEFKEAEVKVEELTTNGYLSSPLKDGWGEIIDEENSKVTYNDKGQVTEVVIKTDKKTFTFYASETDDDKDNNKYKLFK